MVVFSRNKVNRINQNNANASYMKGELEQLSYFLMAGNEPASFAICGDGIGNASVEKYRPLYLVLEEMMGYVPIIIIHNNNIELENEIHNIWERTRAQGNSSPLWITSQYSRGYEPFYGMGDAHVVAALRRIAKAQGYDVTARFDRVIRAHLRIIRAAKAEISLSWLNYLSSFYDMVEFQNNVFSLPCSEREAEAIWADLLTDSMEFDLFRTVIHSLSDEAVYNGWDPQNTVSELNCLTAIKKNAVLSMSINTAYAESFLTYIAEELRPVGNGRLLLIFDSIPLTNPAMMDFINNSPNVCIGTVFNNICNAFGSDEDMYKVMERMRALLIFKHGTGTAATKLSEIIGNYEELRAEQSYGVNRNNGALFSRDRHNDIRFSYENKSRVMPEDITGLGYNQAIIFNTVSDEVIFFN